MSPGQGPLVQSSGGHFLARRGKHLHVEAFGRISNHFQHRAEALRLFVGAAWELQCGNDLLQ